MAYDRTSGLHRNGNTHPLSFPLCDVVNSLMQGSIIQDLMMVNQTSLETQMVELADTLLAGKETPYSEYK